MRKAQSDLPKSFTLIELMMVIAMIAIIAAIAIPNLVSARKAANESSAIAAVRTLHTAQSIYWNKSYDQIHGGLGDLAAAGLVDNVLGSGTKSGYRFRVIPGNDMANAGAVAPNFSYMYYVEAVPNVPGVSGDRHFYSDQSGVIRYCSSLINYPSSTMIAQTQALGGR